MSQNIDNDRRLVYPKIQKYTGATVFATSQRLHKYKYRISVVFVQITGWSY